MGFLHCEGCPVCGQPSYVYLPVASSTPHRTALPEWVPSAVSTVLRHFPVEELHLLFGTLRVWAIEVQRRFLYKLRQKDIAVSPPILHANQCLVFCTRLTSVAQGTGFMPVSAPSTDRISLACPSLCTSCGRPVVSEVFCLSLFHGVCVRALCICQPRGKTFALRSLANRSCVTVYGVSLGHVIPITSTAKANCTPVQEMNTCSPDSGWSAQFQALVFQPSTSPQPGAMRVVSVNCGGTAANIAALLSVVLIHDPDVVAIQEVWDVSLKDEVPLKAYEAGSDPCGHLGVTWGVYLCAGKPPLADIILSHPPDLT